MNLFSSPTVSHDQPLAYRMRPRTLDEYVGQEHILGHGRLLRRAIQADMLSSVIFYGPPGTGKTTLARVIANSTKSTFSTLNAVLSGVKELRYEIGEAQKRLELYGKKTILFVDEVHRWNKSQQDALLPWVENGTCILIGATTENPYFEVNPALVSRSRIFQLFPLTTQDLFAIAQQTLSDVERGYGKWQIKWHERALEHLVEIANGDARALLNAIQLAVETSVPSFPPPAGEEIEISLEAAEESIQRKVILYDKDGDYHFDTISAFIKSLRGSDPDAALYWLARMVYAGEDPKYIFRRLLISASEDIGLADPNALVVVEAAARAFDRVGLPEGRFHLAQATLYLATAPKSNSVMGFFDALQAVEDEQQGDIPNHLKDANRDREGFGHGKGYLYPHAYQDHWVAQQYLPTALQGRLFYQVGSLGHEQQIQPDVFRRREAQLEAYYSEPQAENYFLSQVESNSSTLLEEIRHRVFANLPVTENDRILVVNAGYGLLVWEALRKAPLGTTVALSQSATEADYIRQYSESWSELQRPQIMAGDFSEQLSQLDGNLTFEYIIGRSLFNRLESQDALLSLLYSKLAPEGTLIVAQNVIAEQSRLSDYIADKTLATHLKKAEEIIYHKSGPVGWDISQLLALFAKHNFVCQVESFDFSEQRLVRQEELKRWLNNSYLPVWKETESIERLQSIKTKIIEELSNRRVQWIHKVALIAAQGQKEQASS